jgi:sortase (surface protein transpeptidase)
VVDKFVVLPKQVNAQYMSYQNAGGSYITLMGCYPLGTDKKRIMVVAKLVE